MVIMVEWKLVYIRFYDHFTEDDVEDLESLRPMVCEAVGWLVREDNNYYYLANWISRDKKTTLFDINCILKNTVIEIREIKA